MQTNLLVFSYCLGFLVILIAGIAYRSLLEWRKPGARTFGLLMLAMMVWAAFYLLEIVLPFLPLKIISRKILYLGMSMSPPLWLGFALRYTGISNWWSLRGRVFLLTIPGAIAFVMGLTNDRHGLIWHSLSMESGRAYGPLEIEFGPVFWLFTVIAYLYIVSGMLIYFIMHLRSPKIFRTQTGIMLAGVIITSAANLLFLSKVFPFQLDPTPLSFSLSAPLFAIGFFHFGLFNLFPIAAPVIIKNLRDAIIVVDYQNHITDMNPAAAEWLGTKENAVGLNIFDALPDPNVFKQKWDSPDEVIKLRQFNKGKAACFEAVIIHLRRDNQELFGRVLVIHDITQEQDLLEAEVRRSAQLSLLEEVGRQIADSFDEKEILQRSFVAVVDRFGYAEAAISKLTADGMLKIIAIAGTQDFGYRPGYRQELGKGIIGHTAAIRKTYISPHVASDPYYFSIGEHYGSALCVPIFRDKDLFGVLYVESVESNAFDEEDATTLETLANQVSASLHRASLYSRAQEHLLAMSTVQAVSRVVISSLDLQTIFETVVTELKKSFGYTHVSIYLLKEDFLHLGAQVGYPQELLLHKIHISQGVSGRTIKTKTAQFIEDTSFEPAFLRADNEVHSEICVPLLKENVVLGTLNVEGDAKRVLTREDVDLLTALSGPIALAVDNARLHAQVKEMAMTDAVSGLSNRHALEEILAAEVERSIRLQHPLSLIIFDIDSFKEYNDKWGHPAGDDRLKATADLIRNNLRKYDLAARYGGDEFAIVLPNTEEKGAFEFAKRLQSAARASTTDIPLENKGVSGHTLSIGVATFPIDANTMAGLLLAADHAEIMAKRLGKNQIFLARDLNHNEAA